MIYNDAVETGARMVQDYRDDLDYMSMALINRKMDVTRADSRITSVVTEGYTYNGYAAHGMGMYYSASFDSRTGKRLYPADVCNFNAYLDIAVPRLLSSVDPDMLAMDWDENSLKQYIRDNTADGPVIWFLTGRGMCLYFSPTVLTYDMVQMQTVEVLYSEAPEIFNSAYLPESEGYIIPINTNFSFWMDMDLDGKSEEITSNGRRHSKFGFIA